MSVSRRLVILGLFAASLVVVVTAGAASDPRAAQRAITKPDQAAARSLAIEPSEMPSWRPFARYPGGDPNCPKFNPNLSASTITGEHLGRQFVRRNGKVDEVFTSAAWIYKSEKDAVRMWRAATHVKAIACFNDQVADSISNLGSAGPQGPALTVSSRPISLGLPLIAPRQFSRSYRVTWIETGGGGTGNLHVDTIVLGRGPAEVWLMVQRVGDETPPTRALERELMSRVGRELAHLYP